MFQIFRHKNFRLFPGQANSVTIIRGPQRKIKITSAAFEDDALSNYYRALRLNDKVDAAMHLIL